MRLKFETCERALQTSNARYFCHTVVGMGGGPISCAILTRNGGRNTRGQQPHSAALENHLMGTFQVRKERLFLSVPVRFLRLNLASTYASTGWLKNGKGTGQTR